MHAEVPFKQVYITYVLAHSLAPLRFNHALKIQGKYDISGTRRALGMDVVQFGRLN